MTGFYPESVHGDKIYRTRENRVLCRESGIRMSGRLLGRPTANISNEDKKQENEDESISNDIKEKLGKAKRRLRNTRVMAKINT